MLSVSQKILWVGLAPGRIARFQKMIGEWVSAFWTGQKTFSGQKDSTRPPRGLEVVLAGPAWDFVKDFK